MTRDKMKTALVIVDVQNEYFDKKSDYFCGNETLIRKINRLIDFCRKNNSKIIFIRHEEQSETGPFAKNSKNSEIISELHKNNSDAIITKHKVSSFYNTNIEKELQGVEKIIVAGILTNLCVRMFVEEAYDRDFKIAVIKDCCVTLNKKIQKYTFDDIALTRPEVEQKNLAEFLK